MNLSFYNTTVDYTDARRRLSWLPGRDAVSELTATRLVADQLEACCVTAQLTLGVDGHLVTSAVLR